jgi:sulfoxide reductase heme-binding subunit YedZ
MSTAYRAVGWNRQKRIYDLVVLTGVLLFLTVFGAVHAVVNPHATAETIVIRAFGAAALVLLHVVLSIGPLCRLAPRFLPLLYNRRHLGVMMFLLALVHGAVAIFQFHALGDADPLVSVLSANDRYGSLAWFPFQPLGLAALLILFVMAATSHDFWLKNLTPPVWKALHMGVYVAYQLVIAHVVFGTLQAETSPVLLVPLAAGFCGVVGLHLVAGWRERDRSAAGAGERWVDAGAAADIPEGRARVLLVGDERVAVFRHEGAVSAVSNVCRHQNGPLGEGRILGGLITCPWHGYQYRPRDGCSPPPFTEKVPTFDVRVEGGRVLVGRRPHPPGTPVEPARIGGGDGPS